MLPKMYGACRRCLEGSGTLGGARNASFIFCALRSTRVVHFEAHVSLSPPSLALHPPVSMEPWSPAWINHQLGLPADWWPPAGEFDAYEAKAIDLLRTSGTKSGFLEVYASGERWQAKPYVSPGTQRHLGSLFGQGSSTENPLLEAWHRAASTFSQTSKQERCWEEAAQPQPNEACAACEARCTQAC